MQNRDSADWAIFVGKIIMSPPSPLSALYAANQVVVALKARPYGKIRLNTNGWDREKFSIAAWCLRWCRSAGGFGPRGCGPDDFKKGGAR
jgi:hypothetical protein